MQVKLCGFTEASSLACAIENDIDFVGLVFVDNSPRNVSLNQAKILGALVPASVKKVAVLVNPSIDDLYLIEQNFAPDLWQFHGQESPDFLAKISAKFPRIAIIKAFAIDNDFMPSNLNHYEQLVDYFLFDGKSPGSGKAFDWQIFSDKLLTAKIGQNTKVLQKPWFLSGGINFENIDEALAITGANLIDVSSGIEEKRGEKSCRLIGELMVKIKKLRISTS